MGLAWALNALALAFGAVLGARALIDPKWAQRFVRLQPDEQGGGAAEFRATYGGVFVGLHATALVFTLAYLWGGEFVLGVAATGASAVLSAGWGGSAFGRLIAIWRDGVNTPFNRLSAGVEALLALAIAGPWLVWFVS